MVCSDVRGRKHFSLLLPLLLVSQLRTLSLFVSSKVVNQRCDNGGHPFAAGREASPLIMIIFEFVGKESAVRQGDGSHGYIYISSIFI